MGRNPGPHNEGTVGRSPVNCTRFAGSPQFSALSARPDLEMKGQPFVGKMKTGPFGRFARVAAPREHRVGMIEMGEPDVGAGLTRGGERLEAEADRGVRNLRDVPSRKFIGRVKGTVEQGEIRESVSGKTLHVSPDYDAEVEKDIAQWFERYYSIRFRNYPVSEDYLHEHEIIPCE